MYGGVEVSGKVSAELWAFDISANAWENITVRAESCAHLKLNPKLPCGKNGYYYFCAYKF